MICVRVIGPWGVVTSVGDVYPDGAPVLLPDHEARALVARGRAVVVGETPDAAPAPAGPPAAPVVAQHRDPKPLRRR